MAYTPGSSGVSEFLGLSDTPGDYSGQTGKVCAVNGGETALEFVVGGGGGGLVDDSTTEQALGINDVDGDALHQKTVTLASHTGGTNNIAHGITGLKRVRSLEGSMKQTSSGDWLPIPYASGAANIGAQIAVDATNVKLTLGSFWTSGTITLIQITLIYSKT